MSKATTSKTKSFTMRVPNEIMAQWTAEAKARGVTIGALVLTYAKAGEGRSLPRAVPVGAVPLSRGRAITAKEIAARRAAVLADKPVTALNLPVLTDFPPRPVAQRGADKPKGKRS